MPAVAPLLAMILWASPFIALKIAFLGYGPMVVVFGRMSLATRCFLAFRKRLYGSIEYRAGDYKLFLFMVLCEPCLSFTFEAMAVKNTTGAQAAVV